MTRAFAATIDATAPSHRVSPTLFGLFLEDINFACDGGLNANLVRNFSFDGVYLSRKNYSEARAFLLRPTPRAVADRLRYWHAAGGRLESRDEGGPTEPAPGATPPRGTWYARLHAPPGARLENPGHVPPHAPAQPCAMAVSDGAAYRFGVLARTAQPGTRLEVYLADAQGAALCQPVPIGLGDAWQPHAATLTANATALAKLVISCPAGGQADLDCVELRAADAWGEGDPRWRQGRLRRDLVETLRELAPRFLRFPGGCIVEGSGPGNEYDWRDTVGPLATRRAKYNLWGAHLADGGYSQSYQIGFYEYFLLCEDLGLEPVPTLFAGLNCQFRSRHHVHAGDADFTARVIAPYLDLIDYATGDPATNPWAKLRADAGHPAPFRLNYIGIGNENHGPEYREHFDLIAAAIARRAPGMTCIMSAGAFPAGRAFREMRAHAAARPSPPIVDEHCYARPGWFRQAAERYDRYDRQGPKVYMGEYAANFPLGIWPLSLPANCWETALAEAAFLTGIERNSDIVAMTSYAPLLAMEGGTQWAHNLITFNGRHVLRSANFFVQSLFAQNLGEAAVAIRAALPAGIYASATRSPTHVIVKLVNTTAKPWRAELALPGCAAGTAEVTLLHSADLRARNSFDAAGVPVCPITPRHHQVPITAGQLPLDLPLRSLLVLRAPLAGHSV